MSLINEALKKAQRVRHEETPDAADPVAAGGGARIAKRGRARNANTVVLLGSGAVVLIVLSVVFTVYLVNRTPAPASKPAPAPSQTAIAPNLVVPTTPSPSVNPAVAPTPPTAPATAPNVPPSTSVATDPTPKPAPVAPAVLTPAGPAKPDERVSFFLESIKVMGIRSSGTDSRVLMNERVYRVNDLVDRTLGVKLIAVAAESVTFSDPSGATYVKHF